MGDRSQTTERKQRALGFHVPLTEASTAAANQIATDLGAAMESAVSNRPYLLGDTFSMADVIFGGTVRYMISFKMLEPRPALAAYADRLGARPAFQRSEAKNAAIREERGLNRKYANACLCRAPAVRAGHALLLNRRSIDVY